MNYFKNLTTLMAVCCCIQGSSAIAAQFIYAAPMTGTPAPVQIGTFDRQAPSYSSGLPSNLYLSEADSNLGSILEGDSITRVFSIVNNSNKPISSISARVETVMGDLDASSRISCTPPATLNSAVPYEVCDVIVSLNAVSIGDQAFVVKVKGYATSAEFVEGSFSLTASVVSQQPEIPVTSGISFKTTAEDPIPNMFNINVTESDMEFEAPTLIHKTISVLNSGSSVINEILAPTVTSIVIDEFQLEYSECGTPSGEGWMYDEANDNWYIGTYPAEPVTLNPGDSCDIHVTYSPSSLYGYSSQGALTVNSSVGIISASLTGVTPPATSSTLDVKFASTIEESEIPGFYQDLSRSHEFFSTYLTQVGAFDVAITGSELVKINSVTLVPLKGWVRQDDLISGSSPLTSCFENTELSAPFNKACRVYVGFQADNADNQYSFRLDISGVSQSGAPVIVSRTVTGTVPYSLGVSLYTTGYSLNASAFNIFNSDNYLFNCGAGRFCGVYQVQVGNGTQEDITVNSLQVALLPEHYDFDVNGDTYSRGCSNAHVYAAWQELDPELYPGFYSIVNDWTATTQCSDTFMITQDRDFVNQPSSAPEGYVSADIIVNYTITQTGEQGTKAFREYIPLIFINLQ